MPAELYGPAGLLVFLVLAVTALARELRRALLDRIADLESRLDVALEGWREQTEATERVADALEQLARRRARTR